VVISSPGLPPAPLSLAKLRKGNYRPCSRNAVLAQSLAVLNLMEQRGSGLARMKAAMLDHGLDAPQLDVQDGYFQVILPGPGKDLERLRVSREAVGQGVTPAVEAMLGERQKKMVEMLLQGEALTSRKCEQRFGITRDTANRDFGVLVKLGVVVRIGAGRSTTYVLRRRK
jgi:predicted HTH transcriptional regulator